MLRSLFLHVPVKNSPEGVYRALGFVHLYQSSGIHLLAFFAWLEFGLEKLWLKLKLPIRHSKIAILILCSIAGFWIWSLQSFALSFMRPMISFYIRSFFKNRGTITRILIPIFLTLVIDACLHRGNLLQTGMIHFYLSVMGGLLALNQAKNKNTFLKHAWMAVGSWIPIAMIDLIQDHLVSFMTPLYSLFTIPVVSGVLYPISLIFILFTHGLPNFLCEIWEHFMEILLWIPNFGLTWGVVTKQSIFMGLFLSGGFIFAFSRMKTKLSKKILIFFGFMGLFVSHELLSNFAPIHRVVQLDVGQGDSALIQAQNKNEMIDLGSYRKVSSETWIRKLARNNVTELNAVLFTHLDEDHVGGIYRLLPLLNIDCVETNSDHLKSERGERFQIWVQTNFPRTRIQSENCIALSQIAWFQSGGKGAKGNDLMAGTYHELNENQAYFALGDGDQEQEKQYGQRFKNEILSHPKRIWKVSHHGSKFSSNPEFLAFLDPDQFWISVGRKNSYHHPNPLTLLRLEHLRGSIHRTDTEGDLETSIDE